MLSELVARLGLERIRRVRRKAVDHPRRGRRIPDERPIAPIAPVDPVVDHRPLVGGRPGQRHVRRPHVRHRQDRHRRGVVVLRQADRDLVAELRFVPRPVHRVHLKRVRHPRVDPVRERGARPAHRHRHPVPVAGLDPIGQEARVVRGRVPRQRHAVVRKAGHPQVPGRRGWLPVGRLRQRARGPQHQRRQNRQSAYQRTPPNHHHVQCTIHVRSSSKPGRPARFCARPAVFIRPVRSNGGCPCAEQCSCPSERAAKYGFSDVRVCGGLRRPSSAYVRRKEQRRAQIDTDVWGESRSAHLSSTRGSIATPARLAGR